MFLSCSIFVVEMSKNIIFWRVSPKEYEVRCLGNKYCIREKDGITLDMCEEIMDVNLKSST